MIITLKFKKLIPYLTIILGIAGIFFIQKQSLKLYNRSNNQIDHFQTEQQLKTVLEIQKKMPVFGFHNLFADWQFLQFIQYFGDNEARNQTGYPLVADYFEIISDHDPRFVNAYLILSIANSIYAGRADVTVPLMNKILQSLTPETHPLGNFLWTYKAADEILFLGDIPAAKHSYEMAAEWALARGDEDGKIIAARNQETANFLAQNPNSKKAQVGAWTNILNSVFDDQTRNRAIEEIKSLGGQVFLTPEGKFQVKLPEID
jgi:hypothetical protein